MHSLTIRYHEWSEKWPTARGPRVGHRDPRDILTPIWPNRWLLGVAAVIIATALLQAALPSVRLLLFAPELAGGSGAVTALIRLFGAFVLLLFPMKEYRHQFQWLAVVCILLGVTALVFNVLVPFVPDDHALTTSMYIAFGSKTIAMLLLCIAFLPASPPPVTMRLVLGAVSSVGVILAVAVVGADGLPSLTSLESWSAPLASNVSLQDGLTLRHWMLSTVPLVLSFIAYIGFIRRRPTGGWPWWLSMAMLLMVGWHIHSFVLPSGYSPGFTTSRMLSLSWASLIAVGAVLQMHRVAQERHDLLLAEREDAHRLRYLASRQADFTSMVAHELGGPVAAVRSLATIADLDDIGREGRSHALQTIQREAKLLGTLVRDVQSAGEIEREEFAVSRRPFSAALLLTDAARYARTRYAGEYDLVVHGDLDARVCADPYRIRQVLGNLLDNAAKYSPTGSTVRLTLSHAGHGRVAFDVVDQGFGIPEEELDIIVEKYGRGRNAEGGRVPGLGLGLYLTRQILRAHGSDLSLRSTPGHGTTARFELEVLA